MMSFRSNSFLYFLLAATALLASPPLGMAATSHSAKAVSKPSIKPKSGVISRSPYLGAIAIEAATGKVLFEDHADAKGYPASMLKLMDLLIILEKVQQGQLSLQVK